MASSAAREVAVVYMPLSKVRAAGRNPKEHDLPALMSSYRAHGFVAPLILDEKSKRLVAGHGRLEALRAMRSDGEAPPNGVHIEGTQWLVPVVRGVTFPDPAAAEAYLLADNHVTELGGWDDVELLATLQDLQTQQLLEASTFTDEDMVALMRSIDHVPVDRDALPDPEPRASVGDIWVVGRHRVACGDASDPELVARLLGEARPALMLTDPPYGVNYDPAWRARAGVGGHPDDTGIANDDRADWSEAYLLFPGDVAYVWHSGLHASEVEQGLQQSGFELRGQLIWVKRQLVLSRGHYHWRHEPCWYAVRKGAKANWMGGRKQTTILEEGPDWESRARPELWHPNQKPLELMVQLVANHRGDVYDPFCGSGSSLCAASEMGRAGFGIDVDPKWVDMTVTRLEQFTGQTAVKA